MKTEEHTEKHEAQKEAACLLDDESFQTEKHEAQKEAACLLDDETKLRCQIETDINSEKETTLQFRYLHHF